MKKNGGTVAAIGAMALAILCCAGLPLMIGAIAAGGVGEVVGGIGVAVVMALIAIAVIAVVTRRRQHRV